jgi:hypothetical protein
MTIGEIYIFNNSKVRINQFDAIEVFYEPWNKHTVDWYYSKVKTMIFFRASTKFFSSNAVLLKNDNKDEKGLERFHTQLPMRLNRFENLFWSRESQIPLKNLQGIDTPSIELFPTLQSGRHGKSVTINESARDGGKLMKFAYTIQAPFVKDKDSRFIITTLAPVGKNHKYYSGIGIYRLGLKGNKPSYYIGGYHDFTDITKYENTPKT